MKKGIFVAISTLALSVTATAYGNGYGSQNSYATDNSSKVGQQNTGYSDTGRSSSYNYRTYYEPYYYWYCGRRYIGYRAVQQQYENQPTTVNNPVGAVNTDNSIAYHYEYNITYSQLPQQQGTALYGYPNNPLVGNTYQNTDLAVLDQYVRLQSDAQGYLNEGHARTSERLKELMALAQIQSLGSAATAETLAKGLAIAEANRSQATLATALSGNSTGSRVQSQTTVTRGDGQTRIDTATNGYGQTNGQPNGYGQRPPNGQPNGQPPANGNVNGIPPPPPGPGTNKNPNDLAGVVTSIFQQRCVKCHGGTRVEANLDLRDLSKVSQQSVDKILARVIECDPTKRMPLADDKSPGDPLPFAEIRALFAAAGPQ